MRFNWHKIIKASIVSGIVGLVLFFLLGLVFEAIWPGLMAQYTTSLFRPWSDPWMSYVYVNPFVFSFFMAIIYYYMKDSIKAPKTKAYKKGVHFGFLIWLLGIPGMLMSYSSFPLSTEMVLSWTISILIQYVAYGVVIAKIFEK